MCHDPSGQVRDIASKNQIKRKAKRKKQKKPVYSNYIISSQYLILRGATLPLSSATRALTVKESVIYAMLIVFCIYKRSIQVPLSKALIARIKHVVIDD